MPITKSQASVKNISHRVYSDVNNKTEICNGDEKEIKVIDRIITYTHRSNILLTKIFMIKNTSFYSRTKTNILRVY